MKKQRIRLYCIVAIMLCVGIILWYSMPVPKQVPYRQFADYLQNGLICTAEFSDTEIAFTVMDENNSDILYVTANLGSPDLAERLLLSGAQVTAAESISHIASLIFDAIFYGLFIIAGCTIFKKFISPNTFKIVRNTGVTFTDIVGMDDLKQAMIQIADILRHPTEYKKKGIRLPKGILMEGAPGNGKTLFARALAKESGVSFIPAKATDFESMFMSIGPAKVKLLFKKARRHAPCIVFIDEFDGIGTKRNYNGSGIETENTRIVTALLNELDGFTVNDGVLVLAATNSRAALDEALIRPGRFDAIYTVPYPDYHSRVKLAEKYMTGKPFSAQVTPEMLAHMFDKFSCAQIESVINKSVMIAVQHAKPVADIADIQESLRVVR